MTYATNQEKLSSTVFRSIMRSVKADAELREILGDAIRPQPEWWLNGDPHITGHVSVGNVALMSKEAEQRADKPASRQYRRQLQSEGIKRCVKPRP